MPADGSGIWGNQLLAISFTSEDNICIITTCTGWRSEVPLPTEDNPFRAFSGVQEISFCTECVTGSDVTMSMKTAR